MPVFISHSFQDKAEFDNIADALELAGIECWKPGTMRAGALLSDQLRESISLAELCIFIATRNSVASAWCGAELGAFWGTGKPVLIFVAETTLKEDDLPGQFKGHMVERRIGRLISAVQTYLAQRTESKPEASPGQTVAAMTPNELKSMLLEAIERTQDAAFVESSLLRIALAWPATNTLDDPSERIAMQGLLSTLLGVSGTAITEGAKRSPDWTYTLSFSTDTGEWFGFAQVSEPHQDDRAPISYYRNCLVWRAATNNRVEAIAIIESITDHDYHGIVGIANPLLVVGRKSLGTLKRE